MMKRIPILIWLVAAMALLCCCAGNPSAADPPGRPGEGNSDIQATEDVTGIYGQDGEEDNEDPPDSDDNDDGEDPGEDEGDPEDEIGEKTIDDYKIKPGDILSIDAGQFEIIKRTVQVDDKGFIKLFLIERVKVKGKTKWEAEDFLAKELSKFFKNPQITVEIINLKFFIGGEVRQPGVKPIQGNVTLTQAIQVAGGGTAWANMKKVTIKRMGKDGEVEVKTYDCEKINKGKAVDPFIKPDDQINVPR
jgi:polysaccharide export outer membrane protein